MADIRKGGGLRSLAPIVDQTEQFLQQKNVPKEQVVPFLMSLGRPELAGAVADRMRLDQAAERMKMMQQGQSAPPTVAQENRMQAMQMGQMMAQRPQPMASGIQSVAPPQNMAGGGIVAFQSGSTVRLPKSEVFSDAGLEEFIRNNFPGWDTLPEDQKREVARAMKDQYLSAQGRAMQREAVDPRMRRDYVAPAAAAPAGIAAVAPKSPAPPAAAPTAPAPAGFVAPDTQGELFDQMLKSASRPDTPAAPAAAPIVPPAAAARSRPAPAAPATSASGIQLPDIAKPQTREQVTADRIAAEKAAGITGDATKAYEDFIKSREAGVSDDKKAAYKNAWMMAGARLLGSRSPFFAQALGEAAEAGISGYQKDLKEIKAAEQAFKQASMQLAMNKEAIARGDLRADSAEVRRQEELYGNRQLKLYELQEKARDSALDRAMQLRIAELRNVTGGDSRIARLQGLYESAQQPGLTPQEKQQREDALARQLQADREFTAATTSGGYSADVRSRMDQAELLQKVRDSFTYRNVKAIADNPARPQPERDKARADMARMEQEAMTSGGGSMPSPDYAPRSQNVSGGPYSSLSDDQVRQKLNEQFGIR
jgi:hypothetical protein